MKKPRFYNQKLLFTQFPCIISNFEIAPKIFLFLFQRQFEFCAINFRKNICFLCMTLDTLKWDFFLFRSKTFFENDENSNFFCLASLSKPWSMTDNLKSEILKLFFVEKNAKIQKFVLSLNHLWKIAVRQFRLFSMHCKCTTANLWCYV